MTPQTTSDSERTWWQDELAHLRGKVLEQGTRILWLESTLKVIQQNCDTGLGPDPIEAANVQPRD